MRDEILRIYRLFATVRDAHGGAAVANVPLRVDAPVTIALGADAEFPLTFYTESTDAPNSIPAGWMGDATAINVDPECMENPQAGATCMKWEFKAGEGLEGRGLAESRRRQSPASVRTAWKRGIPVPCAAFRVLKTLDRAGI